MEGKKSEAADRIGFGTITQVSFVVCSILLFAGIDAASAAVITVSGSTSTDIQNAVNKANSGDTVFIPAGWYKYREQIYVATPNLLIKGVGVDSNNPTAGTYLYTDKVGDSGAIISIRADGVRVTGIAFRGKQVPAGMTPNNPYNWASVGIHLQGAEDVRIDHCYFTSCRLGGISVRKNNPGTLIDHNWFVDNWIGGLGYGVCIDVFTTGVVGVKIFIEDNYFENNRHDVAAGFNGCYVARHNHSYNNEETSRAASCHNFDAHGPQRSSDPGTYGAEIYNNYVEHAVQVGGACLMRGIVTNGIVYNNTFKTLAYGTYFSMYDGGPTGTDKYYIWNNTYIDVNQELRIAPNGWKVYRYAPAGYTPDPYPHPQNDDPCHPGPNGVFMCPDTVTGTISGPVMDTELLIAAVVSDATYYVAADGGDSNPGTQAEPWRTIGKANQELQAGDTVIIREGTYNEIIEPFNSGSEGHKIIYKNYPGETVYIKGESGVSPAISIGWKVHGNWDAKSYIAIDGFHVSLTDPIERQAMSAIRINGDNSKHNEVRNCVVEGPQMDRLRGITITKSDYNIVEKNYVKGHSIGITLGSIAQYNTIRNNTVLDPKWSPLGIGSSKGVMQGNLIENNIFCGGVGEDGVQFERDYDVTYDKDSNRGVILRNNIFCNNGENAIDLKGAAYIVIEGNVIYGNIGSNDGPLGEGGWNRGSYPGGIMHGSGTGSRDVIIRNNILYDNEGAILPETGYKIYNNNIIANNRDYTGPNSSYEKGNKPLFTGIEAWNSRTRVGIKNNIMGGHNNAETALRVGSPSVDINNNCYFNDDVGGAKLVKYTDEYDWDTLDFSGWKSYLAGENGVSGKDTNSIEADPLFVNVPADPVGPHENFDFHLQPGSPAIDAGAFLTKTTNSGSGTQISVEDAGYFCDGFGITDGDLIQLGSNSPVRITNVDYDNNKITVERSISWNKGDGVSLPYSGSHPDIGAYEFGNALIPKSKD